MPPKFNYMHSIFFPDNLREIHPYLDEELAVSQILGPTLTPPPRVFTLYELEHYYNGQNGAPAYVSANGIVFDITHNEAWHMGSHFSLTPGHDYSSYFTVYHSNALVEMATRVPVVGRIVYPNASFQAIDTELES